MQGLDLGQLDPIERMHRLDQVLSHVWMVRTFLKHSEEATEDDELASVHRDLYDFMLALGPSYQALDALSYLRIAKKKLRRLLRAAELFHEIQPEVSGHMNFRMASLSLRVSVEQVQQLILSIPASVDAKLETEVDDDTGHDST